MAAGKGTRMNSDLPKVLHPVGGRAMIHWVIDACERAGSGRSVVIVGHNAPMVQAELASRGDCEYVLQTQQLGTGHAVKQAAPLFADQPDAIVLVLCGDGPLIRPSTLQTLVQTHKQTGAAATLATAVLQETRAYGRIVRDAAGRFLRIVEEKDATEAQRAIREVNPSYYCFRAGDLFAALDKVGNDNAKGEYYLTDVFEILIGMGRTVSVVEAVPAEDVLSINTPDQLLEVDGVLRKRLADDPRLQKVQS